jgi:hypothetical protein
MTAEAGALTVKDARRCSRQFDHPRDPPGKRDSQGMLVCDHVPSGRNPRMPNESPSWLATRLFKARSLIPRSSPSSHVDCRGLTAS